MYKLRSRIPLFVIFLTTLIGCEGDKSSVTAIPEKTAPVTTITNVTLFDGEQVFLNTALSFSSGKITYIGPDPTLLSDSNIIDGTGKMITPGFIDSHTHSFNETHLKDALRFGVTTQLDMFTPILFAKNRRAVRYEYAPTQMADLYSSGTLVTSAGGHGTQFGVPIPTLDTTEDASNFIRTRLAEGSDYIKIAYEPNRDGLSSVNYDTLKAAINAAHQENALALVHISKMSAAKQAVAAGADGLVHTFADQKVEADLLKEMIDKKVFIIPTLSIIAGIAGDDTNITLSNLSNVRPFITESQDQTFLSSFGDAGEFEDSFNLDIALENTRLMHQQGIPILAGTDAPNPSTAHGVSIHQELSMLVKAGLTPKEAITAATITPAKLFSLQGRGYLEKGARADFILFNNNLLKNINDSLDIHTIYKNGYAIDRTISSKKKGILISTPTLPGTGMISDFDTDLSSSLGPSWQPTTDEIASGTSTSNITRQDGILKVTGTITTKFFFPWAGASLFFGEYNKTAQDWSDYETLTFNIRGNERPLSVMFFTKTSAQRPAVYTINAKTDWQTIRIPLNEIRGADMSEIFGFAITAGKPKGTFWFEIDDVILK